MKLVKQQLNGSDHVVLKTNATADDLRAAAARLHALYGYDVQPTERPGRYVATHPFFRGKFELLLEGD